MSENWINIQYSIRFVASIEGSLCFCGAHALRAIDIDREIIMNNFFKSIWNSALGAWVATSELTKSHGKQKSVVCATAIFTVLAPTSYAQSIGLSGSVGYANPPSVPTWNVGSGLGIGVVASGSMNVLGGATVNSTEGYVGQNAGASGSALISGAGSSWNTGSGWIWIANNGANGDLTIANGATVSASTIMTGTFYNGTGSGTPSGVGNLTVTGAGSTANQTGSYFGVGVGTTGNLLVEQGGVVNSTSGNLGLGITTAASGTATVTGAGSKWSDSGVLYMGYAGSSSPVTGTLNVSNGGAVAVGSNLVQGYTTNGTGNVNVDGKGSTLGVSGTLTVGLGGSGVLSVTNGATVSASGVRLGDSATGTGVANLSGTGTSLTQSSPGAGFNLGTAAAGGTGSMTVSDGAALNTTHTTIGSAGGTGSLTVTGAGSSWSETGNGSSFSGQARIGYTGTGTLNILSGATASANQFSIVGQDVGGVGVANVSGSGSTWNPGILLIGNGVNANPALPAKGTVTLSNGGVINSSDVYLNYTNINNATSTGTLNIGAPSGSTAAAPGTLNAANLYMTGQNSPGTSAGNVSSLNFNHTSNDGSYVFAPAVSSNSVGTATINQIAGNTTFTGDSSGFKGTTNVTGGTLGVTGKLGTNGTGSVDVQNGNLLVSAGGSVGASVVEFGYAAGATGTGAGTVTGTGSAMQAGVIRVGSRNGTGSLVISGGATATAPKVTVGGTSTNDNVAIGGTGTLTVTGAGSVLNQTSAGGGFFLGGESGNGTLSVTNGGTLNSATMFMGFAGGNGTLTVDGAGSTWTNTGASRIGYGSGGNASGTVNIQNGATATNNSFSIVGLGNGSTGTLNVTGAGSSYNVLAGAPYSLILGYGYTGAGAPASATLNLSDGGTVNAPVTNITMLDPGSPAPATGTVNIGAAPGSAAVAPGTLNSPSVVFGGGVGTLNFNHTGANYTFASAMSSSTGTSTVNQLAGNTNLTGNSSGFGGTTNVTGGTLRVNGTLGNAASTVAVSNNATLGGSGTIGGSVAISNGVLAPGNSPGTLTINGNLSLSSASQLNYELGAANTVGGPLNDLTVVGGNLTLDGTLNVTQSAGGTYGAGIYRLINYTGALTNNGLELGSMPASSVNYVQTSVANQVNLINSNGLTLNFWDGDAGGRNDGIIAGGNGTWLSGPTGSDRWTNAAGTINAPYQNPSFAVFQGALGVVTVDNSLGQVAVTGMQFATSGYRVLGGNIALAAGTDAIRVGDGTSAGAATTATVATNLTGAGRLDKVDVGTLVLSGTNSYTGGTQISGGTLQLGEGGTTGSVVGDVTDNATLALNRSDANTISGTISGTGVVKQIGTGNTTLAGTNTYTGGTTISAGTLTGSATSFGSGSITDNAALVINQATDASLANAINGTGTFTKTGSGALTLSGSSALSGATSVTQGTLAVTGSLASSAVTVSSGATLAGTGTVGATSLRTGATISPGNGSIGTLTVNGNYAQAAGSTYQVQVDPATKNSSDLIKVNGTASIAAGSILNVARTNAASYMLDSKYTVLNASGGVSGTYALTGDTRTAFVQLGDTYDANNVYLTATQVRSFTAAGITPNQIATAGGLGTLGSSSILRNAVAFLPNDFAARAAFDQLSGEQHASVQSAMMEDSRFVREAANDRLLGAFCSPGASSMATSQDGAPATQQKDASGGCTPATGNVAWARVFGSTGRMDTDGNAQTLKRDISGIFVGADTQLDGGWRVGGLGGFSHASMNAVNGSGKTDDYHLGVYAGNQWNGTSLRVGASYTWHKLDLQRGVSFSGFNDNLSSKYDGSTAQVFGELGHRIDVAKNIAIEPFAGLAYVSVKTDGFAERGGFAALTGQASGMDTTFTTLGARISTQVSDTTALRGMLGWRHAFGDTVSQSTNAFFGSLPFTVSGVPLAKNVAVVEAGLETELRPNLKLSASYSGQFASKLRDNGVKVSLAYKF